MQSFNLFYLEEMNRRSFINTLISAGTGIANASKLAAAVPVDLKDCEVVLDPDFNIVNITPSERLLDRPIKLTPNISFAPEDQLPLEFWSLHVKDLPSAIVAAYQPDSTPSNTFRDMFKPLIKAAYKLAYATPSRLFHLQPDDYEESIDFSKPREIKDTINRFKTEMQWYERVTGEKLPPHTERAFRKAINDCSEALKDLAPEKRPAKKSLVTKFSPHHYTTVKYSPTSSSDDVESQNIRGIGESVHK